MTRIALIATAAVIALASPAAAGWQNALNPNGFTLNGFTLNGFTLNGFLLNGRTLNGLTNNGTAPNAVIAHSPPPVGLSLGGLDGMKVMSVELPR